VPPTISERLQTTISICYAQALRELAGFVRSQRFRHWSVFVYVVSGLSTNSGVD
jgi:hypothetical protein